MNLPYHPIVVHFPIALLLVGFAVDLAGLLLKRDWLARAALLLLILGSLGAVAARQAGKAEEESIVKTPAIEAAIETHEESGNFTMWFFAGITVVRAALTGLKKFTPAMGWIFVVIWAVGAALLVRTAYYGGELVYQHGVGRAAVPGAAGGAAADDD